MGCPRERTLGCGSRALPPGQSQVVAPQPNIALTSAGWRATGCTAFGGSGNWTFTFTFTLINPCGADAFVLMGFYLNWAPSEPATSSVRYIVPHGGTVPGVYALYAFDCGSYSPALELQDVAKV